MYDQGIVTELRPTFSIRNTASLSEFGARMRNAISLI